MKNKGFNTLFILSILAFIADMVTTLWNLSIMSYLETNPIFVKTGSIIPIILLNVAMLVLFYYAYHWKRCGVIPGYLCINSLVWILLARCIALKNNFYWVTHQVEAKAFAVAAAADPVMHQEAIRLTQEQIAMDVVPLIIGFIVFLIWLADHKTEKRE